MLPLNTERTVLVCDDELEVRCYLETAVQSLGYSVQSARDGDELLSFLRDPHADLSAILLDMAMPNRDGLETLREVRAGEPGIPVIIISGQSSTQQAVIAMKSGAADFLCKPVTHEELGRALNRVLRNNGTESKIRSSPAQSRVYTSANPKVREVQARAGLIGRSGAPVLIHGETGSGKEVLAREIHGHSARASKPFLKLNCAALPSELVESELFGYERGAFTGAYQKKAGIFELADGGTILLDEIGDMDIRLQAKLLQVLQDHEFRRVGGKETIQVDVRVIAATHRDLEKAILEGTFREDLYYRLSVLDVQVAPLRDRPEDIIPLGEFLIRRYATNGAAIPAISIDLRHVMLAHKWPGNVRELENRMRKLVIFHDPDMIASDIHARINGKVLRSISSAESGTKVIGKSDGVSVFEQVKKVKRQSEVDAILTALNSTRWNRKQAAAALKIEYKSLLYKMKKLGIDDGPLSVPEQTPTPARKARASSGD